MICRTSTVFVARSRATLAQQTAKGSGLSTALKLERPMRAVPFWPKLILATASRKERETGLPSPVVTVNWPFSQRTCPESVL